MMNASEQTWMIEDLPVETLSNAYRALRWRWKRVGIPDALEIAATARALADALRDQDPYCESGGLRVYRSGGQLLVRVDSKLEQAMRAEATHG